MKFRFNATHGTLELDINGPLVTLGGALPQSTDSDDSSGGQGGPTTDASDAANDPKIGKPIGRPKEAPIIGRPKDPPVTMFMARGRQTLRRQPMYVTTLKLSPDNERKLEARQQGQQPSIYAVSGSDLSKGETGGLRQWAEAVDRAGQAGMSVVFFEKDLGTTIDWVEIRENLASFGLALTTMEILYAPGSSAMGDTESEA